MLLDNSELSELSPLELCIIWGDPWSQLGVGEVCEKDQSMG